MKFLNNRWLHSQPYRDEAGDGDGGSSGDDGSGGDGGAAGGDGDGDDGQPPKSGTPPAGDGDGSGDGGDGSPVGFYDGLPDDWRNQVAGEDEGRLNDLSRYTTFDKWVESGFEAKAIIRKGELSTGLPEEPSDEQMAEYRDANGIPPTAAYALSLEPGVEMTDMETEIMGGVMEVAHQANIPTAALSAMTSAWLQNKEVQIQRIVDQDGLDKLESERLMRDSWGVNFKPNMGAAMSLLAGIPETEREQLMEARDGSGRYLMSSPYFISFLADTALKANPMANVPGGGDDPTGAAETVIAEVKKIFAEGREAQDYYKDQKLQDRYEQALEAVDLAKKRQNTGR